MKSKLRQMVPSGAMSFACCVAVACASACAGAGNSGSSGAAGAASGGPPNVSGGAGGLAGGSGGGNAGLGGAWPSGGALTGSGGAAQAGTNSDGGTSGRAATGGAATAGAATGGAATGGTAGSGGKASTDTGPYPDITLAGLTTAVELAPVRLAANGIYPAKVTVTSGGVDNLFGTNAALVATNAETQALRSSVQNTNLRIVFTVCEGLYRIVAKKSAGINALADLKGKTVDYTSGTSAAYFLHQMLATVNLSESDVKTGTAPSATSGGQAAAYWEPNMQQYAAAISDTDRIEFQKDDQGNYIYRELFNLHATAESLADPTKRRTIVGFVRSLITASAQITADPTTVYPLMTGPTGVSQAVLEQSFKYERYAGSLVSDLLDQLTTEEVWHAKVNNRTARTRAELAPLIDDTVVQDALAP